MTEINDVEFLNFEDALANVNKLDNAVFNQPAMNISKPITQNIAKNIPIQFKPIANTQGFVAQPQQINRPQMMNVGMNMGGGPKQATMMQHAPVQITPPSIDPVDASSYFSIFGFQLSRTTIYILIAFVVLIVGYIIYSKFFSKTEEKKKKKKSQVSFKSQEEQEEQDDQDNDEE